MPDLSIKQELGRYYVVTEYYIDEREEYLIHMLIDNNISGHLTCRISYEGNCKYLMYDVTNMISLNSQYKNKYIEIEELTDIFQEISRIYHVGNGYLFNERYYYLNPEYIFRDLETNELKLIYIPGFIEEKKKRYFYLSDFLLQRINRKDDRCVQIAYQFYRMSGADTFSIQMFLNVINKENVIHKKINVKPSIENTIVEQPLIEAFDEENVEFKYQVPLLLDIILVIFSTIYYLFIRNTYYSLYGLLGIVLLLVISISLWIKAVYNYVVFKSQEDIIMPQKPVTVEDYWQDEETVVLQEETVVLNSDYEDEVGYKLEWSEKGRNKKYMIKSFPVVIGKMTEEVDCYIDDNSISRLHAKIIKRDNEIKIFDLNSTNGTYVDGIKLNPGEEIAIDTESQIRMGSIAIRLKC